MAAGFKVTNPKPRPGVVTGGTTACPFIFAANARAGSGAGGGVGLPVGVGEGDGGGGGAPKVPPSNIVPALRIVIGVPAVINGNVLLLLAQSRSEPLWLKSVIVPAGLPATTTVSTVPFGKLIFETNTSNKRGPGPNSV